MSAQPDTGTLVEQARFEEHAAVNRSLIRIVFSVGSGGDRDRWQCGEGRQAPLGLRFGVAERDRVVAFSADASSLVALHRLG